MSDTTQSPPAIPLLPLEQARLDPLFRQLAPIQSQIQLIVDLVVGRAGDPDWHYALDTKTRSLIPSRKKVTVTPTEANNGD